MGLGRIIDKLGTKTGYALAILVWDAEQQTDDPHRNLRAEVLYEVDPVATLQQQHGAPAQRRLPRRCHSGEPATHDDHILHRYPRFVEPLGLVQLYRTDEPKGAWMQTVSFTAMADGTNDGAMLDCVDAITESMLTKTGIAAMRSDFLKR